MKSTTLLKKFKQLHLTGFLFFAALIVLAFSSNPPQGKTGAPGEGMCNESGCHTGTGAGLNGNISLMGLPSTISPNTTYNITVTLDNPNGAANRAGFQWVALNGSNVNAGTMSNPSTTSGQSSSIMSGLGRTYHEHSGSTPFPATNVINWTVDWTSPAGPSGDNISFYAVGNIANGSGSSGDRIVFTNASGVLMTSTTTLAASISSFTDVSCFGSLDGSATVAATGGTTPYSYAWDNGETGITAFNLSGGTHTVTVTDNTLATTTANVTIGEPNELIISINAIQNIVCNGQTNGSATVSATGGTGVLSYTWSNGSNGPTLSNVPAGSYFVEVEDINACSITQSVVITEPDEIVFNEVISNTSCNGASDGAIEGSASGGNGNYSYTWSNGENSNVLINLAAGMYTVTIEDSQSCTGVETFTVEEPLPLTVTIMSTTDETCDNENDGTAVVIATGGTPNYFYNWSNSSSNPAQSALAPGIYGITVSDNQNCSTSTSVTIQDGLDINIGISTFTNPSCANTSDGQLEATATGGSQYTYLWSNGQTGAILSNIGEGSYAVTVTDISGCTATINAGLASPPSIDINLTLLSNVSCNGANDGNISIASTGGVGNISYLWNSGQLGNTINNLSAGTYEVTASDDNGCTASTIYAITQPAPLSSSIASIVDISCNGDNNGAATLNVTGGTMPYSFIWPNGSTTESATNLEGGSYTVLVSDLNNCQTTVTVVIEEPDPLLSNTTSTAESTAGMADGTAMASPTGGTSPYNYQWSNGASTPMITNLSPGTYTLTLTDTNLCTATSTVSVSSGDCQLTSTASHSDVSCYGDSNGSITLTIEGATGTPTINWSNGETNTSELTNITSAVYSVTIVDEALCELIINDIFVNQPDTLVTSITTINTPSCIIDVTGELSIDITGGTMPYDILWSTNDTTEMITDLGVGSYSVDIIDGNGCESTSITNLNHMDTEAPILMITDFTLSIDEAGNMPSYDESNFDLGSTDNCGIAGFNFTNISTDCSGLGTYLISVSLFDVNGNFSQDSITLTLIDDEAPVVTCLNDVTLDSCVDSFFAIPTASDNCGTTTTTLVKGLEIGSTFPIGITEMQYDFEDTSGNISSCTFNVIVDVNIELNVSTVDPSCFNFSNGSVIVDISGDNAPYDVVYSDNINPEFLPAGTYAVLVTDSTGCTLEQSFEIINPEILVISDAVLTNPNTENSQDGAIDIEVIGGTMPYTFNWTLDGLLVGTEQNLSNATPGTYMVMIADANGCVYNSLPYLLETLVSTNNPSINNQVIIYPNPSTNFFNISVNDNELSIDELTIYSAEGRLIKRFNQAKTLKTVDVSDLSNGLYLIKMDIGQEQIVKKLSILK